MKPMGLFSEAGRWYVRGPLMWHSPDEGGNWTHHQAGCFLRTATKAEIEAVPLSLPEPNPAQSAETARPAASSSDAGSSGQGAGGRG